MPGVLENKSILEKLNHLVENDHLLVEFVNYTYEINYPSWFVEEEEHAETWCKRAYSTAKFVLRIKNFFDQNYLMGPKKKKQFSYLDI